MLVTFSGCDGAGKTTQIDALMAVAKEKNLSVSFVWGRGGYTPVFQFFKGLCLWMIGKKNLPGEAFGGVSKSYIGRRKRLLGNRLVSQVWLSLAIMDLILFYGIYLRILRARHDLVLCDRYLEDTRIDFEHNFPNTFSRRSFGWRFLNRICPEADLKVVLTIPVSVSQERSVKKNEPFPDDAHTLAFRLACYQEWPEFNCSKTLKIDGTKPLYEISAQISEAGIVKQ